MGAKDTGSSTQLPTASQPVSDDSARQEVEALTLKVEQLSDELSMSRQQIADLKAEIDAL
jgi:hypothetical protein